MTGSTVGSTVSQSGGWSLGLMSGTSLDGIDLALVKTDGESITAFGPSGFTEYPPEFRERLRAKLGATSGAEAVERELTDLHADAVEAFLAREKIAPADVSLVGFHGHTILHRPDMRRTWQIGDGARLAARLGIDVVNDFRSNDVAAGGQGAPLVPIYHAALARTAGLEGPVAILNIGGVANVTWIGADGSLLAFDTGPGNALIDDWVRRHTGRLFDDGGRIGEAGGFGQQKPLMQMLDNPWFERKPPKSLDRDDFSPAPVEGLSLEDGAATLAAFTAGAVARSREHMQAAPKRWLVTGGGRHNRLIMHLLGDVLGVPVDPVEAMGWRGDTLEAEAFAFLAQRSVRGLPLSFPGTTGAPRPMTGGVLHRAV